MSEDLMLPGLNMFQCRSTICMWGANSADQIWRCDCPCNGRNWVRVDGLLKQIDAGDEEVWGVLVSCGVCIAGVMPAYMPTE